MEACFLFKCTRIWMGANLKTLLWLLLVSPISGYCQTVSDNKFYLAPGYMSLQPQIDGSQVDLSFQLSLASAISAGPGGQVFDIVASPVWQNYAPTINLPLPSSVLDIEDFATLGALIGYRINKQLSVETVLAVPKPLVVALNIPSVRIASDPSAGVDIISFVDFDFGEIGLPGFKGTIGELDFIGMIFSTTYRMPIHPRFKPYFGAGIMYLSILDAETKSVAMLNLENAELDMEDEIGSFLQIGFDYQLWRAWSLHLDVKSIQVSSSVNVSGVVLETDNLDGRAEVSLADMNIGFDFGGLVYHLGAKWEF